MLSARNIYIFFVAMILSILVGAATADIHNRSLLVPPPDTPVEPKSEYKDWPYHELPVVMLSAMHAAMNDGQELVCIVGHLTKENASKPGNVLRCLQVQDVDWITCVGDNQTGVLSCKSKLKPLNDLKHGPSLILHSGSRMLQ